MYDMEVVEKSLGNALEIEENVSMMKMSKAMGKDFMEIMNYMKDHEYQMGEAPYSRYVDINWEHQTSDNMLEKIINFGEMFTKKWHFYCGWASSDHIEGNDHMLTRHYDMQKYLKAVHVGSYQEVGKVYKEMYKYIKEHNMTPMPESIEFYMNDPSEVKKTELETMILVPIMMN
jgi:predicted transcriptional regulator YdeE